MSKTRTPLLLVVVMLSSAPAGALESGARIAPPDPSASQERIDGLSFKRETDLPITEAPSWNGIELVVELEGRLEHASWTLLYDSKPIKMTPAGEFKLEVPVSGAKTAVELSVVDVRGTVAKQEVDIAFPEVEAYKRTLQESRRPRKMAVFPGLGLSYISYRETGNAPYSEVALTAKVTYSLVLSPRWELVANGYLTLLPIYRSEDTTARFLGLNLKAGYALPWIRDPWRLAVFGGLYYTTMFVSNDAFGFRNLFGPELYPSLQRLLPRGQVMSAYFKVSPISDGLQVLSLSNNEVAVGLGYTRPVRGNHPLSIHLDLAALHFSIEGSDVSDTSVTLGCAYGF